MERNHETIVSVMGTVAHAAEETLKKKPTLAELVSNRHDFKI